MANHSENTVMITVNTPKELHTKFRYYSFDKGISMTKLLLQAMEEMVDSPVKKKKLKKRVKK